MCCVSSVTLIPFLSQPFTERRQLTCGYQGLRWVYSCRRQVSIFFTFVESLNDPTDDPAMVWISGGRLTASPTFPDAIVHIRTLLRPLLNSRPRRDSGDWPIQLQGCGYESGIVCELGESV